MAKGRYYNIMELDYGNGELISYIVSAETAAQFKADAPKFIRDWKDSHPVPADEITTIRMVYAGAIEVIEA